MVQPVEVLSALNIRQIYDQSTEYVLLLSYSLCLECSSLFSFCLLVLHNSASDVSFTGSNSPDPRLGQVPPLCSLSICHHPHYVLAPIGTCHTELQLLVVCLTHGGCEFPKSGSDLTSVPPVPCTENGHTEDLNDFLKELSLTISLHLDLSQGNLL